ncbi:MAG: SgcJ/EcaC family oxidoreductase [Edaphobacter sp.]|uniref:YybH family protein n=1 Tax=Edaphobacter sp. TaxID=1934404 RepID=UPI0023927C78|nr:SgcJ/EcaC family oxidoreductase [Edaphobacter sp.]MDE1175439.1 SgcJ/EcaC family oxidoreductase [Edaphobacter sp.]
MTDDQKAVRDVIDAWLIASKAGDLDSILSLMTDDALFFTRNGLMTRQDFAASFRGMAGKVEIDGTPDVQEVTVEGDLAVCWNKLEIRIKPPGASEMLHAGNVLTVFRRGEDGRWRLWRDANLLAPA